MTILTYRIRKVVSASKDENSVLVCGKAILNSVQYSTKCTYVRQLQESFRTTALASSHQKKDFFFAFSIENMSHRAARYIIGSSVGGGAAYIIYDYKVSFTWIWVVCSVVCSCQPYSCIVR